MSVILSASRGGGRVLVGVGETGGFPQFLVILQAGAPAFWGEAPGVDGMVWEAPDPGGALSVAVGHEELGELFVDDTAELAPPGPGLAPLLLLAAGVAVAASKARGT